MTSIHSRINPHRPQYTEAELRSGVENLPGFLTPATSSGIFNEYDEHGAFGGSTALWQPVLSTTVVSRVNDEICVLTGSRTADANKTHVNVASTPTMRIPKSIASLVADCAGGGDLYLDGKIDPSRPFVTESLLPSVAGLPDSDDLLGALVGNLLAMKLNLGPVLETAPGVIGRTSLARCVMGFSYLEDNQRGEPLYEPLIMFGAIVGLDSDIAREIPKSTQSYSILGWSPISRYVRGIKNKAVLDVMPSAKPTDELEVCIRGLCNTTSLAIVSDPIEIERHLTEDYILPPMWQ